MCSDIKDNLRFCKNCKNLEEASVENWRGLVKQRQKRSYLEPLAELQEASFNAKKVLPIGLLRNGHLVDLKPIKINSTSSLTLSNTCAFDSLVQIMATTFCDSSSFKELILITKESSKMAQLVYDIVKTNVNKGIYRQRAIILNDIFNHNESRCGIVHLNVETEIGNLLPKLDINPCLAEETRCENCSFCRGISFKFSLEIEMATSSELQSKISQKMEQTSCSSLCYCGGIIKIYSTLSPTHFFIEPLDVTNKMFQLKSTLDSLPKVINISGTQYKLRGTIGYIGPTIGTGHFIAYAHRQNFSWEEYDDRGTKSKLCSPNKSLNCQLLLYSA